MPSFPTIAADTPFNDAATLSKLVDILDERWRVAGSPGTGPRSLWFEFAEADGYTVSGEYDAETDTTALTFSPSTPPMGPDPAGRRIVIDGVGEFTLIDASTAAGDAACTDAAVSMPAKGNKIDAAFCSRTAPSRPSPPTSTRTPTRAASPRATTPWATRSTSPSIFRPSWRPRALTCFLGACAPAGRAVLSMTKNLTPQPS